MSTRKKQMIEEIPTGELKPDPNQPRTVWDAHQEHIDELASSYATQGVIIPLEVDEDNVIVLGECRWRAAKKAGLKKVPVLRVKKLTSEVRLERQMMSPTTTRTSRSLSWSSPSRRTE